MVRTTGAIEDDSRNEELMALGLLEGGWEGIAVTRLT
jgi:hypothetical protein